MTNVLTKTVLILLSISLSTSAFGRRAKRVGFNFGNTFKVLEVDQPSIAASSDVGSRRTSSKIQTMKPYLGYAFDSVFNVGIDMVFENLQNEDTINGQAESQKIVSLRKSYLRGGGLFSRFLFGEVLYFEGGHRFL